VRTVAIDSGTAARLAELRAEQDRLGVACETPIRPDSFVFSFEPGGKQPPYPDSFSHALARLQRRPTYPPTFTCTRCATSTRPRSIL
jgi:hypothetical protein